MLLYDTIRLNGAIFNSFINITPRKFSINTILQLSVGFQTSFLSTIRRFSEIGTHLICIVFSKDNVVKWFERSEHFPHWPFHFKVEQPLPQQTVAHDFFSDRANRHSAPEQVDPSF